jgi:hypothetical protein
MLGLMAQLCGVQSWLKKKHLYFNFKLPFLFSFKFEDKIIYNHKNKHFAN